MSPPQVDFSNLIISFAFSWISFEVPLVNNDPMPQQATPDFFHSTILSRETPPEARIGSWGNGVLITLTASGPQKLEAGKSFINDAPYSAAVVLYYKFSRHLH